MKFISISHAEKERDMGRSDQEIAHEALPDAAV